MESTHKKLCYMASEWERRKLSDRLSDHLMDVIGRKHDEYMLEYRRMDELKRTEAAVQRKRNLELEEYKREKRRALPTWPNSFPYTKWKPDIISWDREHHLTTGSVKFGLLAEMLKNQGRVTIYEQIQVRLGNNRNDVNIITQVVALLDTINEETVYNKLSSAWEAVITLKKTKDQTLNDFFSKFETIQYSLNLADESFKEQEPLEAGKDKKYYEEREQMASRKVEMNDKLKAVQLIKALGVDGTFKRDILSKVDFNKEPSKVYEDTKTAIRDICGDTANLGSNETSEEEKEKNPVNVNLVKPWQEKSGATRGQERFSRSRSWDRRGGNFRDRSRSYSRDRRGFRDRQSSRERSRERSDSRGRKSSVSFQERSRRRDTTPGPGMSEEVIEINESYDRIYINDNFFKTKFNNLGQFMIVDCGSPKSLVGFKEYHRLNNEYSTEKLDAKSKKFRFGPSKVYESELKIRIPMKVGNIEIGAEFYVVRADIPILLGNDVMEPLGGNINMKSRQLELKNIEQSIALVKTPGGHFVVPLKAVAASRKVLKHKEAIEEATNIKGSEAEAVMLALFANTENDDMESLHNELGHSNFVALALTGDEEAQVKKVHRYFGHRSGRRIWDLFAKAEKLKGKRKAVLDMIEKCKICSEMKKSPPRPKVGLPVANDFNEIVGLDLKVLDKNKGHYIMWMVDLFSKMIKGKFIKNKQPATSTLR